MGNYTKSTRLTLLALSGTTPMAQLSWLERLYWKYLSKPVSQRALFLHVLDNPLTSILEIGMGSGQRIAQLLAINAKASEPKPIRYTAIDPFESNHQSANAGQPLLSLKAAHRILSEHGVKDHLIPGEPSVCSRATWSSSTVFGRMGMPMAKRSRNGCPDCATFNRPSSSQDPQANPW